MLLYDIMLCLGKVSLCTSNNHLLIFFTMFDNASKDKSNTMNEYVRIFYA